MTNQEILKIAMEQSAKDLCANASDFEKRENVIVLSRINGDARKYLKLPFSCQLVSYGNNVVASVLPEYKEITESYINKYPTEHLFETPNLHVLNDALIAKGQKICFMAEYFLPDINILQPLDCPYELRILTQNDFADLYLPEWSNALCKDRKHLDVLGIGAYDNGKLIGLAGCSADCDTMWQIGIDVLPEYRRQGIASALTSRLAIEIIKRGKVPFYCAAWLTFYNQIMESTEENLIIVSHDGTLSIFFAMWLGMDICMLDTCNLSGKSGGVSFLQEDMEKHRIILRLNDLSYMQ